MIAFNGVAMRFKTVMALRQASLANVYSTFCHNMKKGFWSNKNNNNNNSNNLLLLLFSSFINFILIYKLNIHIQISLIIGNLYSAGLITAISSIKKIE